MEVQLKIFYTKIQTHLMAIKKKSELYSFRCNWVIYVVCWIHGTCESAQTSAHLYCIHTYGCGSTVSRKPWIADSNDIIKWKYHKNKQQLQFYEVLLLSTTKHACSYVDTWDGGIAAYYFRGSSRWQYVGFQFYDAAC